MLPREAVASPVVLDTNIVLDLWVFDDPAVAALQQALASGQVRWLRTDAMRQELERVLTYPHVVRALERRSRNAAQVMAHAEACATAVAGTPPRCGVRCADPDDQMFLDLAHTHAARLISKDHAVLRTRRRMAELGVLVHQKWE